MMRSQKDPPKQELNGKSAAEKPGKIRSERRRSIKHVNNGETIENAPATLRMLATFNKSSAKNPSTPNAKKDELEDVPPLIEEVDASPSRLAYNGTFQLAPTHCQLGIMSSNKELDILTLDQMALIQEAIIDVAIEKSANSGFSSPNFNACVAKTGWLLVYCSNRETAEWMRANFARIELKCGIDVVLVEAKAFPIVHVISGCFPWSLNLTNTKVLATISTQNPELSTHTWNIVKRTVFTTGAVRFIFVIDDSSMSKLHTMNYKIAYRFGRINLNSLNTKKAGRKLP